ncbi:MAG: TolC family protein [Chlorobi bacterium]|nr:TolC family protein [Chlorobiota bacterium]
MAYRKRIDQGILTVAMIVLLQPYLSAQDTLVSYYVQQGLEHNLALSQKNADYKKSLQTLNQARSYFMPSLSFNARYTVANGGRTIDFPVGDLLNPVYQTLNILTASDLFPTIENQSFYFYRPTEHETKLELIQPLFNPQIGYNYKIQKEVTGLRLADMKTYKRQLVAEIKKAYYTYLKMNQVSKVFEETMSLVKENVRLNRKLLENQKITVDVLYRSLAELSRVEREQTDVEKNLKAAANWFNFLLNRPLNSKILIPDTLSFLPVVPDIVKDSLTSLKNREELQQLEYGLKSADYRLKMEQNNRLPTLFAVVDYGFQGKEYRFNMHQDFTLASVVMRWDLFKGMQNKARIAEARFDRQKLTDRKKELQQQILMQVDNAGNGVIAAQKAIIAAKAEALAATKAFRAVDKRYRQGMVPYIEYLDALTTMSNAKIQVTIAQYDYLISLSEYERVTATYLI